MQRFETKYDLLNAAYRDNELKKGCILLLQYLVYRSVTECYNKHMKEQPPTKWLASWIELRNPLQFC